MLRCLAWWIPKASVKGTENGLQLEISAPGKSGCKMGRGEEREAEAVFCR